MFVQVTSKNVGGVFYETQCSCCFNIVRHSRSQFSLIKNERKHNGTKH